MAHGERICGQMSWIFLFQSRLGRQKDKRGKHYRSEWEILRHLDEVGLEVLAESAVSVPPAHGVPAALQTRVVPAHTMVSYFKVYGKTTTESDIFFIFITKTSLPRRKKIY